MKLHFSSLTGTSDRNSIIVVSGLPRSGTSMMMKMLVAGKIEVLTDNLRAADDDNPEGYFEFERVKKLRDGDFEWLDQAKGKAVKVISALLEFLPPQYRYRVVFMQRRMSEILASQQKMLANRGKANGSVDDETMAAVCQKHLDMVQYWLSQAPNFRVLEVDYNRLLTDPTEDVVRLSQFLNRSVDVQQIQAVIDTKLYRQRF
jgi:Sulfotransferase domain